MKTKLPSTRRIVRLRDGLVGKDEPVDNPVLEQKTVA